MVKYESECVDCGLPCLHEGCPYYKVERHYCDECEVSDCDIYEYGGRELCLECLTNLLRIVNR